MKDQFANYVVQKILETCNGQQRDALLSRMKGHLQALRKYTFGKHIASRIEQLSGDGAFPLPVQLLSMIQPSFYLGKYFLYALDILATSWTRYGWLLLLRLHLTSLPHPFQVLRRRAPRRKPEPKNTRILQGKSAGHPGRPCQWRMPGEKGEPCFSAV